MQPPGNHFEKFSLFLPSNPEMGLNKSNYLRVYFLLIQQILSCSTLQWRRAQRNTKGNQKTSWLLWVRINSISSFREGPGNQSWSLLSVNLHINPSRSSCQNTCSMHLLFSTTRLSCTDWSPVLLHFPTTPFQPSPNTQAHTQMCKRYSPHKLEGSY